MSIVQESGKSWRVTYDEFNPRVQTTEYKCAGCGEWMDEQDVIWADDSGELNTDTGKPWCDACLP